MITVQGADAARREILRQLREVQVRVSAAINAGLSEGAKEVKRIARRESTLKASVISRRMGTDTSKPSTLSGVLWVGGEPFRSLHFASVDQDPRGVRVSIFRRAPHVFPAAWQQQSRGSGSYRPVWQRVPDVGRYPIFDPVHALGIGLAHIVLPYKKQIIRAILDAANARVAESAR